MLKYHFGKIVVSVCFAGFECPQLAQNCYFDLYQQYLYFNLIGTRKQCKVFYLCIH